jgi:hypothetical protein
VILTSHPTSECDSTYHSADLPVYTTHSRWLPPLYDNDTQHISLYLLFNERYWAPVFASQVLTEEPGLTWVAFTLNSSILYDTPSTSAFGLDSSGPD